MTILETFSSSTRSARRLVGALVAVLGIAAPPAGAQEGAEPSPQARSVAVEEHSGDERHGDEHHFRNELAAVLGGTWESEEEATFFTVGLEYERILSGSLGAAAVVEHIADVDAWVAVASLDYRPVAGLKLVTGPGVEFKSRRPGGRLEGEGHSEDEAEHEGERDEQLFLWRFGVAYSFEVGERFVVTPGVDLDLVREEGHWVEAVVFDVAVGFGF